MKYGCGAGYSTTVCWHVRARHLFFWFQQQFGKEFKSLSWRMMFAFGLLYPCCFMLKHRLL